MIQYVISYFQTGLCLLNRPRPQQSQPSRNFRRRHRLRYEWERVAVVRSAAATVSVYLVSNWRPAGHTSPYRSVPGLLQHIRAGQPHSQQRHAAGRGAHVLRFRQLHSPPLPLHLPRQECAGPRPHDPLLRGRQHSSYDPTSICSRRTGGSWRRGRGHEGEQWEWQPPLRTEFVDVALWTGTSAQGLGRGGHGGTGQAPSRVAGEGGRHSKAAPGSVRFSCGSCRMNARKLLKASISPYEKDLFILATFQYFAWHSVPA